jgi:hypothetical protein
MSDIDLKHTDERLIEVLANINPHLAPYTAALGKEAAARILILESNLRLEQIERCKCIIKYRMWLLPNSIAARLRSEDEALGGRSILQMIHDGDGHEAIAYLEDA